MMISNQVKQKVDVCVSSVFSYKSSSEEEVVLIHVEIAGHLPHFGIHLEAEEQSVDLKQTKTRVPAEENTLIYCSSSTSTDIHLKKRALFHFFNRWIFALFDQKTEQVVH